MMNTVMEPVLEKEPATVLTPHKGRSEELWYFIGLWLLLNGLSAFFTELSYDEAYYWLYSKFLSWGYFDHPPMIAWMDKAGDYVLHNELGLRLATLVFSALTILVLARLSGRRQLRTLMLVVLSCLPFHLFGFFSVPDVPLLLFTAVFFYAYQKFIKEENITTILFIAFAMAALMYSKYHGLIIISSTLVSNPKLLFNKKFLIAAGFALALYLPHLYWQLTHDFVSLRFHFFDRSAQVYQLSYTFEYLFSQPLYYGPVTGFILLYITFISKADNRFEKALQYSFYGIFVLFLFSTFKGRVEPNWTLPALVPMVYFTVKHLDARQDKAKWLRWSVMVSLPLFIGLRALLAFAPEAYVERMGEFTGWRSYAAKVMKEANGLPVVANSYQDASKLSYYTGKMIPSLNIEGRHNQFDLWGLSYAYEGRKVLLLNTHLHLGESILNPKSTINYLTTIAQLPVYQGLQAIPKYVYEANRSENVSIDILIHSLSGIFPLFSPYSRVHYKFFEKGKNTPVQEGISFIEKDNKTGKDYYAHMKLITPAKKGKYILKLAFNSSWGEWKEWRGKTFVVK